MPRYFFDMTATVWHLRRMAHFSGIQRGVVMQADQTARIVGPENVHLCWYDRKTRSYRTFPYAALAPGELITPEALRLRLSYRPLGQGVHPILRGYSDRPLKLVAHRLMAWANWLAGRERYFTRRNTTRQAWWAHHFGRTGRKAGLPLRNFDEVAQAGDHLVLVDGTVNTKGALDAFRAARQRGLHVSTVIHDLIPLACPELVAPVNRLTFHDWLRDSASYTGRYLANSQATRRDLDRFLQVYGIDRPVNTLPHAQARLPAPTRAESGPLLAQVDLSAYPELAETGIGERVQAISAYPFVLCVGLLQNRKNIWRLATVWDRLRHKQGIQLPKLVFAGRSGWMKDDFDALLRATGNVYGWVEVVEPTDAELEYLYRRCQFVAMPSLYEGWGLPVGEALSYGKTAVVSNISSLPEVGGDLVEYCDPHSLDSIAEACLRLIRDPARREGLESRIRATKLRSWADVAADLVAVLKADA